MKRILTHRNVDYRNHFTLIARDGLRLTVGAYPADGDGPVLLLQHGIASHMGWYRSLATMLAAQGVAVYTPDRRGVGLSEGARSHMKSWRLAVDDLQRVTREIRERHPGRPIHLLGISLGGVFCSAAAIDQPHMYKSVINMAPGFVPRIKVPFLRRLRVLRRSLVEPRKLYDLPFGVRELTDRRDWQEALEQDGRRTSQASARFLVEMFRMQKFMKRQVAALKTPTLVLLGGGDAIIENDEVIRMFDRTIYAAVRIEVYEGLPHILPSSIPLKTLCERLRGWLDVEYGTTPVGQSVRRIKRIAYAPEELPHPPDFSDAAMS